MFSMKQKQEISRAVQEILRDTNHIELPHDGEITFTLRVEGDQEWSWAVIKNNGQFTDDNPVTINAWNEFMSKE